MYSPKIKEALVIKMFQIKQKTGKAITRQANEAIEAYLETMKDFLSKDNQDNRGGFSSGKNKGQGSSAASLSRPKIEDGKIQHIFLKPSLIIKIKGSSEDGKDDTGFR